MREYKKSIKEIHRRYKTYKNNRDLPRKITLKYLNKNHNSILDLGCGANTNMEFFKEKGYEIEGIDIEPKVIDFWNRRGFNVKLHNFEKSSLKKKYNFVIMYEVLEHLKYPEKFLKNLSKSMEKNAYLIISSPNRNSFKKVFGIVGIDPNHFQEYTKKEVKELLSKHFKIIEFTGEGKLSFLGWYGAFLVVCQNV